MKKSFSLWLFLTLAFCSSLAFAGPGKPFSGTITYALKVSGNIPAEMESMMPKKAHYQVSEKMVRIDMEPSVQGAGAIITDYNLQTMRMQLEIPDAKYQMIMDEELKAQTGAITNINYTGEKRQ